MLAALSTPKRVERLKGVDRKTKSSTPETGLGERYMLLSSPNRFASLGVIHIESLRLSFFCLLSKLILLFFTFSDDILASLPFWRIGDVLKGRNFHNRRSTTCGTKGLRETAV
jgi:hypothetical protein